MSKINSPIFNWSALGSWFKQHKLISAILGVTSLVVVIIVGLILWVIVSGSLSGSLRSKLVGYNDDSSLSMAQTEDYMSPEMDRDSSVPSGDNDIRITESRMDLRSEDLDEDEEKLQELLTDFDAYIYSGRRTESKRNIILNQEIYVPIDNFQTLFEALQDNFEIKNYSISDFVIKLDYQVNELEIIKETLAAYGEVKEETQQMPLAQERVDLLMSITEKELKLKSREKQFSSHVKETRRRGDEAKISLRWEQKLPAELWPEDIGLEFRAQLQNFVTKTVSIGINILITTPLILLLAVQWIIYILAVLLPIILVACGLIKSYRFWLKRKK
ncbi:MAG: hypothetical protein ACOCU8_01080 [Patescibacteria group bacterium]